MVHQGRLRVEAGESNLRCEQNFINDGNWHHIAVTYDPADGELLKDCKLYIDGVLATNSADSPGNSFNSETRLINTELAGDVYVGQAIYSANHRIDGLIDDLRIINVALTPEEISAAASE